MAPTSTLVPLVLQVQGAFLAQEEGAPPQQGGPDFFFMIAVILAIFWFVAILPERKQRKKKQAMLDELKKNDRILTSSGMYGTVAAINDNDITIKFDEGPTRVRLLKSSIATVLSKEEAGA